jgi:DHA1 family bicyclomycin/chloramphenicol resistance-like MFS transporter
VQAFVSLVISAVMAGAISPLLSGSMLALAIGALASTAIGFGTWRMYRAIEGREMQLAATAARQ